MENSEFLFRRLHEEGYDLINQMIETKQEEHLFLDFKEKKETSRVGLSDDDRKNFAKALSGYSNSAGGVIVWGISTKRVGNEPDAADDIKPISSLKRFLTDLNSLISDALVPINPGVQNILILKPDEEDTGFIVTYVPESQLPPHRAMCKENKYYVRAGDSFVIMEHYMLADAFGRRQKPNLELYCNFQSGGTTGNNGLFLELVIGIKNTGRYLAKFPSIFIDMDKRFILSDYGVDGNYNWNLKKVKQTNELLKNGVLFAGTKDEVIHQNSLLEVAIYHFHIYPVGIMNLIKNQNSWGNIEINYEIYAENFISFKETIQIPFIEVIEALRSSNIINDDNDD